MKQTACLAQDQCGIPTEKEKRNYLKFQAKPIVAFLVVAVVNFKTVL
jgi:hypothetical protein